MEKIETYDTTLRDGAQAEEVSFSVEDKLRIVAELDRLGVSFIEGGWPGANPIDTEFFERVKTLNLRHAVIAAFGSTHSPANTADNDKNLKNLIASGAKVVTIFGKTWDFQVRVALKVTPAENLRIIRESVACLKRKVGRVFFDAEHFFDGYKSNPFYAVKCLLAAEKGGADCLILCDTNGGSLPQEVYEIVKAVKKKVRAPLGIHAHNDSETATANSLMAVLAGATQVQGTINGIGERCGNANLVSLVPDLELKMNLECVGKDALKKLKSVSRFVNEVANLGHLKRQPFVGDSAFAHKGGRHVSAVRKDTATYEHIRPEDVGNKRRILVDRQAGKANIMSKAEMFGIKLPNDSAKIQEIENRLKELEGEGYHFEAAEASLDLLMRRILGFNGNFFVITKFRVIDEKNTPKGTLSEATVKIKVGGETRHKVADSKDGPVNALDLAIRKALAVDYPKLKKVALVDYKVRVLNNGKGTESRVRVLCEWAYHGDNGSMTWTTVGVSKDILEASEQAIVDSYEYVLHKIKTD